MCPFRDYDNTGVVINSLDRTKKMILRPDCKMFVCVMGCNFYSEQPRPMINHLLTHTKTELANFRISYDLFMSVASQSAGLEKLEEDYLKSKMDIAKK